MQGSAPAASRASTTRLFSELPPLRIAVCICDSPSGFFASTSAPPSIRASTIRPSLLPVAHEELQRRLATGAPHFPVSATIDKRLDHVGTELAVAADGIVERRVAEAVRLVRFGAGRQKIANAGFLVMVPRHQVKRRAAFPVGKVGVGHVAQQDSDGEL